MKNYFPLLIATIVLLSPFSHLQAADYGISPLIIDRNIEARESFEETVKITNSSDRKLRLFPTVNEITVGSDGEILDFVPASMSNNATSVTSWIAVTRGRVEINPGETIKVPVTVSVSPTAVPGEYHAFIGFAEGSKRDEAELKVQNGSAPGVVVRLSLSEKRSEYLRLQKFSVARFVTKPEDTELTYVIENVGEKPLTPKGEIIFYDVRGSEKATLPVNPEQFEIRAQSSKEFVATIPAIGAIGKHKAFINIEYGSTQRANLYDTTYFNIVPLKILISLFISFLVVSILLALYYHRRTTKHSVRDEEEGVSVYVRSGVSSSDKDHDINLKQ